jgi:DNA repair exonuclease SbcCD ATPase subunit
MSTLTDRIILLLRSEASSEALAQVVEEAQEELASLTEACEEAKERVMDPFSTSSIVMKSRKEAEDLTLEAARLELAIGRLTSRLETARGREREAERVKRYDETKAKHDALTAEFQQTYPKLAEQIATMLMHLKAADQKVAEVNADLPIGSSWLPSFEQTIRTGLGWSFSDGVKLPALSGTEVPEHLRVAPGQVQFWPMTRGF